MTLGVASTAAADRENELAPAFCVIAAAIITLATVMTMRETAAQPLRQTVHT
jgi:MHS family proline/betaine transporter-like MFS transporter